MGLISKIFGTYSQRQIKKILATVDKIEELADKYRTTQTFLRAFHLKSLDDLPEMSGLEEDGQLRLDDLQAEASTEEA